MYKQVISNTNFSYGEISPYLFGRGDIEAYKSGAMTISNMTVIPTGGIKRRDGTKFISQLSGVGKLLVFEYSSDKVFLLCFTDKILYIYDSDNNLVASLYSPFSLEQLSNIRWSQKGNLLFIVHKDIFPKILKYIPSGNIWKFEDWVFDKNPETGASYQPFAKFDDTEEISLTPSNLTGEIELEASDEFFDVSYVGTKIKINGGEVLITEFISFVKVKALVIIELEGTEASYFWQEQAFSCRRGYPKTITFHQNRLVIGASKSLPNRLWFSKTGNYFNFDLGEGLDDEAIEFDMLSDKVNEIVCVFSGRHLQVFTSDSEWMVSGLPLTPSSLSVKQQTKIGSVSDRFISPKLIEGSTVFVAKNNKEIREFFYGDITENYSSEDLILLSNHLMNKPKELDYDIKKRLLYVLQSDGTVSVLLLNKTSGINAWFKYETCGEFISLCVFLNNLYVIVKRENDYFLEVFTEDIFTDSSLVFKSKNKTNKIVGISHLNNKVVSVNADNYVFDVKVLNGEINLPIEAENIFIGLPYTHILCPLPFLIGGVRAPKVVRLFDLSFRVMDTPLLQIDTGDGLRNITCRNFDREDNIDNPIKIFSGDVHIKAKGLLRNFNVPLWKLQSSKPYNVNILNVSATVGSVK
ncbi:hypothetical protein HDR60_05335 [bacterium]|nr:hypothetical protein [bacterium]